MMRKKGACSRLPFFICLMSNPFSKLAALWSKTPQPQPGAQQQPTGPAAKPEMTLDQIIESLEDMSSIEAAVDYTVGQQARIHNLGEFAEGLEQYNDRIITIEKIDKGMVIAKEMPWMGEDFPKSGIPFVFLRPYSELNLKLDI